MSNYVKIAIFNVVLCLFVCCKAVAFEKKSEETVLPAENLQRLTTVIANIKKYYYKSVDVPALLNMAIKGILVGLDPHSDYLDSEGLKYLQGETSGKFGGIGVAVYSDNNGVIKVAASLDDSPAYRAGIKTGDYIVQINDKLVRNMTVQEVISAMRGPKGSKLNLTIVRKNKSKPLVVSLRREIIKAKMVRDQLLEPGYGYIRLALFQEPTEEDMVKAIKKLKKLSKGNLKGLILDMRNNYGGLVFSAVSVVDDFLDAAKLKNNSLIVYTKSQNKEEQIAFNATPGELLPNVPLVVLINGGSASASEIVAGALQDHKRAIVVGVRSFGKGSMQALIPVGEANAILLTTALYYTPLGRSIQAKGIEPDIIVEDIQVPRNDSEPSLPRIDESAFIDHIKNNGDDSDDSDNVVVDEDKKFGEQQKKSKSELELMYKDYQLYEALRILKVMKYKSSP